MTNRLLHTALFLLGLLGTSILLQSIDAMPYFGSARPKFAHWLANGDRYDTAVLGSSRVHEGFNPSVFDERMQQLGRTSRSFNLGFGGMQPHDYFELGHTVADRPHASLRRVIVELTSWLPRDAGDNWLTDKQIQGHTLRQLAPRLHTIWKSNVSWTERVQKSRTTVVHTCANFFRIGQGQRLVDDLLCASRDLPLKGTLKVRNEGIRNAAPVPEAADEHKQLLAKQRALDRTLEFKRRNLLLSRFRGGFNFDAWQALDTRLRALAVEPVYVVMPIFDLGFQGRDAVAQIAQRAIVIDLDRPDVYPELFELDLWRDTQHLNSRGAEVLSRCLAERFVGPVRDPGPMIPTRPAGLEARWQENAATQLVLHANDLPDLGEALAVVSLSTLDIDIGYGMRARVGLPGLQSVLLPRTGPGTASAVIDTADFPKGQTLYIQAGVHLEDHVLCVTSLVTIGGR